MTWRDLRVWCVKWERRFPFKFWYFKFYAGHLVTMKHLEKVSFSFTCMKWSDLLGWCLKWERRCPFKFWNSKFHAGYLVIMKYLGKVFLWLYLHEMKCFAHLMREMRAQMSIRSVTLEISCQLSGHYEAPRKRLPMILPAWNEVFCAFDAWNESTNFHLSCDTLNFMQVIWLLWST